MTQQCVDTQEESKRHDERTRGIESMPRSATNPPHLRTSPPQMLVKLELVIFYVVCVILSTNGSNLDNLRHKLLAFLIAYIQANWRMVSR
jgi:hypothetical protein